MKSIFILLALLIVCTQTSAVPKSTPGQTITDDPCSGCRNTTITITDTWAGQCFPSGEGATCACVCGDVFCHINEVIDRSTCVPDGRLQDCRCIPVATTLDPPTTVFDPCSECRNSTISNTDTWAGHCIPNGDGPTCRCACNSIFCRDNEVIDRTTCVPDVRLEDCRCVQETTTVGPPTTVFDACSECRNSTITITDTWAGHCTPNEAGSTCTCVCGNIFCRENEVIDRTTCVPDGRLQDCRCIPAMTTLDPPTTVFDPCSECRNSTISITDTWAGHCTPNGEGPTCRCACNSIFCRDNEVIDRTTCVPEGRLEDCRCIPGMTTLEPPTTVFDPCSECRNTTIAITDTWAGHCIPNEDGSACRCACNSIFCRDNEVIDRTTCVPEGRLEDCRCIPGMTTLEPPTSIDDPCLICRNSPVIVLDTWASQCRPFGPGAVCSCICTDVLCQNNEVIDRSTCTPDGRIEDCRCVPGMTTLFPPTTHDDDPCRICRNSPIAIFETWASHCRPSGEGAACECVCTDVFCHIFKIIDRSTCTPDGRIEDCRCIPGMTTVQPLTTMDPCHSCRNSPIHILDNWAGQCGPYGESEACSCVCADIFCHINEIIDRSTCVPDGRLQDCRCISITDTY